MLKSRRSANAIAVGRTAAEDQVPRIFLTPLEGRRFEILRNSSGEFSTESAAIGHTALRAQKPLAGFSGLQRPLLGPLKRHLQY